MEPARKIRKELYASDGFDGIWWLGNAGFAIRLGVHHIFIDPDVTSQSIRSKPRNPLHAYPLEVSELEKADLVLYTHEHGDHMDRGLFAKLVELKADIWAPEHASQVLLQEGVPAEQIHVARAGLSFSGNGYTVEVIRARHGSRGSFYFDVEDQDACACGFLINTRYGTIYHPGDTYYLEEFAKLQIDFLLLPICDTDLGVGFAALLTHQLQPRCVIPCHYGMYAPPDYWQGGHPAEYVTALATRGYSLPCTDIMILKPGGKVILS